MWWRRIRFEMVWLPPDADRLRCEGGRMGITPRPPRPGYRGETPDQFRDRLDYRLMVT